MEPLIANVDQQIQADLEELRARFPNTQELYREVCILLFFRHGIAPTANKLYQLVRKGSMSAPAEALNRFWSNLREKSRARIEHPDLPEEIKMAAGELAATLWTQAQNLAHASLISLRLEAQAQVVEAKLAEESAKQGLERVSGALGEARHSLEAVQDRIRVLEQALAAETATRAAIEEQLHSAREINATAQQATEEARREFAAELEKLRSVAQLSDERYRAAEQRALLEIDRERTTVTRVQKELDAARDAAATAASRHRAEIEALQRQNGDLRQRNGTLDGNLQATTAAQERTATELADVHYRLELAQTQIATVTADRDNWQRSAAQDAQMVAELRRNLDARSKIKPARAGQAGKPKKDVSAAR